MKKSAINIENFSVMKVGDTFSGRVIADSDVDRSLSFAVGHVRFVLTSHETLAIEVGDRVNLRGFNIGPGTVLMIDGAEAWIKWDRSIGGRGTKLLTEIHRI